MTFLLVAYLIILALITAILFVVMASSIIGTIRSRGVPFVPLTKAKLKFLQKKIMLNGNARLVDLGCGDGRVLQLFEKQGVAESAGYEVNWWAMLQAILRKKFFHLKTKIHYQNFQQADLSDFNVVFCYLLPNALLRLREKFDRELRPGAKVISYDFEIKNWRPASEIFQEVNGKKKNTIFIYEI